MSPAEEAAEEGTSKLELCFKGDRSYLHGTDILDATLGMLRGRWPELDGRCRMAFHRPARRPLAVQWQPASGEIARPAGCLAEMHLTGGRPEISLWMTERAGDVECRHPYDEEAVVRGSVVDGNRIVRGGRGEGTAIEAVVALTKRLHYSVLRPEHGAWLFTRLDLVRLLRPEDRLDLSITMTSPPRTAITRSEIRTGSTHLGWIFFSVGPR